MRFETQQMAPSFCQPTCEEAQVYGLGDDSVLITVSTRTHHQKVVVNKLLHS
jgi:hypothetical protein